MPNSWAAAIAMSRAEAMSCETSQLTRWVLRSRALAIASSMADFLDQAVEHEPLRQAGENGPDRSGGCGVIVQ